MADKMNSLHILMIWEKVYGRERERDGENDFIKPIICPVTDCVSRLCLVTPVRSGVQQLYVSAHAHFSGRVGAHVCFSVFTVCCKYKKTHQHGPHFLSLFDAFKMLITGLLCATSNANALFYGREVGPTLAFAYLMSVFLACMEELDSRQSPNK